MDRFLRKVAAALDRAYHLLVVDLQQPGPFDPKGLHAAIWEYLFGTSPDAPPDQPRTLVSYRAEPLVTAYVEPIALDKPLPDMPLFLDAAWYVNVPLEETYMSAWAGLPEPWKQELRV
jgi:hypothetical protein